MAQSWQQSGNQVDKETSPTVQYGYDSCGRLQTMTYPDCRVVEYNYDNTGRVTSITDGSTTTYAEYTYQGDGTVTQVAHPEVDGGLNLTIGLDNLGRVADYNWTNDNQDALDHYTYTYDADGNRVSRNNELHTNLSEVYYYDSLNRLIDTQRNGNDYQSWTLDQLGNWSEFDDNGTSQTRTFNATNEIATIDNNTVVGYDSAGETTHDQTFAYKYDAWGHLVEVRNVSDSSLVATYQYDGRGYRIAKTVGEATTHYFYNENWQVLEEHQGDTVTQYVWDVRYIDTPVCRIQTVGTASPETLYYTTDANMNVTALIQPSDGSVVERYSYEAYGKPTIYNSDWSSTVNWASSSKNEILYCGYRYNPETDNAECRTRYLDFDKGWLTRDSGYWDTKNLREYVRSSPTALVDPFGMEGQPASQPAVEGKIGIDYLLRNPERKPPGYSPDWPKGEDNGRKYVEDPATHDKYYPHESDQDDCHWDHYDHDWNGKRFKHYPENSEKVEVNRKAPPKPGQSLTDPWDDLPKYKNPSTDIHVHEDDSKWDKFLDFLRAVGRIPVIICPLPLEPYLPQDSFQNQQRG